MKHKCVVLLFALFCSVLSFSSCGKQDDESTTSAAATTFVNNIYITDDGVYSEVVTKVPVAATQFTPQTTQPTAAQTPAPQEIPTQGELPLAQYSAQMILDKISAAVNMAKQQTDFSAHQLQQVTINVTDCTLDWAVPIINGAIGTFIGPHDFDYNFVNGQCLDPKEDFKTTATPMSAIPPSDRLFSLEKTGLASWTAYEENGEYVYTVTLFEENTDNTSLIPYYHAQAMDYLDLDEFDFGIGEITESAFKYPGATVTVRTMPDGTLLKYEETIPMSGSGTGKLGVSVSASFEGVMYECWTFVW